MFELPRAVASLALHIEIFGQGGNVGGRTGELPRTPQNDLGPVVIQLHGTVNFDVSAFELVDVANVAQIAIEYHHGEGTNPIVLAEIEEAHSAGFSDVEHPAGNANGAADVRARLLHRDAFCPGDACREQHSRHSELQSRQHFISWVPCAV